MTAMEQSPWTPYYHQEIIILTYSHYSQNPATAENPKPIHTLTSISLRPILLCHLRQGLKSGLLTADFVSQSLLPFPLITNIIFLDWIV